MFGLPGGNKNMRTYPTVQKVMDKFYEIHEGSYDADITKGEIPKVKWSTFMYVFFLLYRMFHKNTPIYKP